MCVLRSANLIVKVFLEFILFLFLQLRITFVLYVIYWFLSLKIPAGFKV